MWENFLQWILTQTVLHGDFATDFIPINWGREICGIHTTNRQPIRHLNAPLKSVMSFKNILYSTEIHDLGILPTPSPHLLVKAGSHMLRDQLLAGNPQPMRARQPTSVWSLYLLPLLMWVSIGFYSFLPHSKHTLPKILVKDRKLSAPPRGGMTEGWMTLNSTSPPFPR